MSSAHKPNVTNPSASACNAVSEFVRDLMEGSNFGLDAARDRRSNCVKEVERLKKNREDRRSVQLLERSHI